MLLLEKANFSKQILKRLLHVKGTDALDFRAENDKNLEILEKNSLDLYSSLKVFICKIEKTRVNNSIEDEDDWGNLNN